MENVTENYIILPDGTRKPAIRGGVRQELTEADIIYNSYQYARALSDAELSRYYSVSTQNGDTCGECFCCICGKVLKERKIERRMEFLSTDPEHIAKREKRLKDNEQRVWDEHMRSISPKG